MLKFKFKNKEIPIRGPATSPPSLFSCCLPFQNSFRRIGPGCWKVHEVKRSSIPIRMCADLNTGLATNVEYILSGTSEYIYLELAISCGNRRFEKHKAFAA